MKTHTHTPGPWNVEHPYGEPGTYVSGPNTGLIAKLYTPDAHLWNVDRKVSIEANAHLIAAAPDLLAALRLVYANAGESPEWIRARIGSVISKAEGQA